MRIRFTIVFVLFLVVISSSLSGFAEGTKELMPNQTAPTRILLDPSTLRDPFALYSSYVTKPDYRLMIHIEDPANEKIYFGTGQQRTSTNNTTESKIDWRIHKPDGTVECTGQTPIYNNPPTVPSDKGYIESYEAAVAGPDIIDPAGYDAIICTPTLAGDYFITFNATSTRTFDYIDITVVNTSTTPPTAIPGRVYTKCWQIRNPDDGGSNWFTFSGKMYIYSNDGIVTKFDPNNFEGRDFSITSNESGCFQIGGAINAQQARRSQPGGSPPRPKNYPQFKIFLNNPDINVYPDGVIGQMVDGSVIATPNCNGTVDFSFETTPLTALGTVEITLQLSLILPQPVPPYADRILIVNNVPGGIYTVNWDGKDANGVFVANGSTFPFSLRYTKGLTHLPLWDVENNLSGFKVNLVRPVLIPPLPDPAFYWDDQLVSGASPPPSTINVTFPGCTDPTCHGWGDNSWPNPYQTDEWGNERTINTWWYLVSNSTTPVTIKYIHNPGTLVAQNPPTDVCQGETVTFTVQDDPHSEEYHWVWDGGTQTTTVPTITITFPAGATPGASHVYVNGWNLDCPNGPVLDIPLIMHALPNATLAGSNPVCRNSSQTYTTTVGMSNYVWNVTGGSVTSGGTSTSDNVTINWNTAGPGNITVSFTDPFGCGTPTPATKPISINPLPTATVSGNATVCLNSASPLITFSGASGAPPYTFTYNINGGPVLTVSTTIGNNVTVSVPTTSSGTFTYNLVSVQDNNTPSCSQAQSGSASVTVKPLPTATISGTTTVCQNSASPQITFSGASGTPPYTFTYNINGGSNQTISTLAGSSVTLNAPTNITGSFTYNLLSVQEGSASACTQAQTGSAIISVNPLPTATISGNTTVCQNSPQPLITFTGGSTSPPYTFTYNINGGPNQTVTTIAGNSISLNVPTNLSGTFTYNLVSVQDNGSPQCSQSQSGNATVTVNPLPTATISGTTSVCRNSPSPVITFSGSSGTSPYTFTYNINGGSSQTITTLVGNSVTLSVPTTIDGTYTYNLISVQDASSTTCSQGQTGSAAITIKPLPSPSLAGPATACINTPGPQYTTDPGMSGYTWTIAGGTYTYGATNDIINVIWTANGTNTVTVNYTAINGCTAASPTSYNVNVSPLPAITITGLTDICTGIPTNYTTQAGMSGYIWNISAGGTINSGTGTNSINVTWNTPGANTVSVNYTLGSCPALSPQIHNVTVNQSTPPVIQSSVNPVCESFTSVYTTQTGSGINAYSWTISPGGTIIAGGGPASNTVTVRWNTPGSQYVRVNFANQYGCVAPTPTEYSVTVNPLPNTVINGSLSVCQDFPTLYQYQTAIIEAAPATYTWQIAGVSATITPNANANPINVNWNVSGNAIITVNAVSTLGCPNSGTANITVNPKPDVSLVSCIEPVTSRSAKRFQLKGGSPRYSLTGSPLQGEYLATPSTPALQADISGNYYFNPSVIPGNNSVTYSITYRYTNQYGCPNTTSPLNITVLGPNPPCGATMTDPRDGKVYTTTVLGGRCWMTQNLNYNKNQGVTAINTPQTDNCVVERYCPPSDPTCSNIGAYYQWNELVQYQNTDAPYQGVCPPGWHVPTEVEWQSLIDNLDPAFSSPEANALVGSMLKDPSRSFRAFLEGINYLNSNTWNFTSGLTASMFWTSTPDGSERAIARGLNNPYNSSISRYSSSHANAFPVRCLRD